MGWLQHFAFDFASSHDSTGAVSEKPQAKARKYHQQCLSYVSCLQNRIDPLVLCRCSSSEEFVRSLKRLEASLICTSHSDVSSQGSVTPLHLFNRVPPCLADEGFRMGAFGLATRLHDLRDLHRTPGRCRAAECEQGLFAQLPAAIVDHFGVHIRDIRCHLCAMQS